LINNNELHIIIQGCINQNRNSQQNFYEIFYGYSAAICMRYTTLKEEMYEIVNEGFYKVYKEIKKFEAPLNENLELSLKAWLKRIMINTSIDYYRKYHKNEPNFSDVDSEIETQVYQTTTPIEKLTYDEVLKLINQLSPMYKLVFNLHIIDGLSHEEISKKLNISVGTSKSNLSKARYNIIKLMENKYQVTI